MTTDWAEKKANDCPACTKLLMTDYRRTLRLMGTLEKACRLNQYQWSAAEKAGYLKALADLRAALTKGRT